MKIVNEITTHRLLQKSMEAIESIWTSPRTPGKLSVPW